MLEQNAFLNELTVMKKRMEALYSESLSEGEAHGASVADKKSPWEPAVDVWETETEWLYVYDLPGVDKADLQVVIHEGRLTVDGERRNVVEGHESKGVRLERPVGAFRCSIALPASCRADAMRAELNKGVLRVALPKAPSNVMEIKVQPG